MCLPKISVIIPSYNHEQYVVKCLESVVGSYSGELEVIICDDCSVDKTVQKIEEFIYSNTFERISFSLIKHKSNKGVASTLNECVQRANSDYIYAIASDDYLLVDGLTTAMTTLLDEKSDAVISDCIVVNEDDKCISKSAFFEYRHASLKRLYRHITDELVFNWVVPGPALLQKKAACIEIGGFDERLMAEDRDYYLRFLSSKNVVFNERVIAGYRVHLNNSSRSEKYMNTAKEEFNNVNYSNRVFYKGLARFYLKTYWLDINHVPSAAVANIRRVIKFLYIMRTV